VLSSINIFYGALLATIGVLLQTEALPSYVPIPSLMITDFRIVFFVYLTGQIGILVISQISHYFFILVSPIKAVVTGLTVLVLSSVLLTDFIPNDISMIRFILVNFIAHIFFALTRSSVLQLLAKQSPSNKVNPSVAITLENLSLLAGALFATLVLPHRLLIVFSVTAGLMFLSLLCFSSDLTSVDSGHWTYYVDQQK
jgi:hypothetical protein